MDITIGKQILFIIFVLKGSLLCLRFFKYRRRKQEKTEEHKERIKSRIKKKKMGMKRRIKRKIMILETQ